MNNFYDKGYNLLNTDEGSFVTLFELDHKNSVKTGTARFNSPAEAKAFAASTLNFD